MLLFFSINLVKVRQLWLRTNLIWHVNKIRGSNFEASQGTFPEFGRERCGLSSHTHTHFVAGGRWTRWEREEPGRAHEKWSCLKSQSCSCPFLYTHLVKVRFLQGMASTVNAATTATCYCYPAATCSCYYVTTANCRLRSMASLGQSKELELLLLIAWNGKLEHV